MKIILCDDDAVCANKYKELLVTLTDKYTIDAEIVIYNSGEQLLFELEDRKERVDVIFLDIYMPGLFGIEVANNLREMGIDSEIIFLTKSKEFLLAGYDVGAFHYIVKDKTPVEKIEQIFCNIINKLEDKYEEIISFSCAGENRVIKIKDIRYFEVNNRIVTVHYGNKSFEFYTTLTKLEDALLLKGFIRIHRAYLVSLDYIVDIKRYSVKLTDNSSLPVGRYYYQTCANCINNK